MARMVILHDIVLKTSWLSWVFHATLESKRVGYNVALFLGSWKNKYYIRTCNLLILKSIIYKKEKYNEYSWEFVIEWARVLILNEFEWLGLAKL